MMTAYQIRVEYHYTALKLKDRATPGRTPWQTLRAHAEQIAAEEFLGEGSKVLYR